MNLLRTADVHAKLAQLPAALNEVLLRPAGAIDFTPARDAAVRPVREHPDKRPLTEREGQGRLLHDLASIELQAMELGLRTLHEFGHADRNFREELAAITEGEGKHLRLCLEGLQSLGYAWGDWPVHLALWQATSVEDSLLDRILIVHRYLEGSGLDAGESIFRRLCGVDSRIVRSAVQTITDEEVGHVEFGSRWYRAACRAEGLDPSADFEPRLHSVHRRIPRRMEPIARERRIRAGFTEEELGALERSRSIRYAG